MSRSNTKNYDSVLLAIIKFLKDYENQSTLLKELPNGSWQATASQDHEGIFIELIRNDKLLMDNFFGQVADPIMWLRLFVPPISKMIASMREDIPKDLIVKISVKSETEEYFGSVQVNELLNVVDSGRIARLGAIMMMFDIKRTKYKHENK